MIVLVLKPGTASAVLNGAGNSNRLVGCGPAPWMIIDVRLVRLKRCHSNAANYRRRDSDLVIPRLCNALGTQFAC